MDSAVSLPTAAASQPSPGQLRHGIVVAAAAAAAAAAQLSWVLSLPLAAS